MEDSDMDFFNITIGVHLWVYVLTVICMVLIMIINIRDLIRHKMKRDKEGN